MDGRTRRERWWVVPACFLVPAAAAAVLHLMGRPWWCKGGEPWLWSGAVWSMHNSQHLFDPYSFTHVTHGVLLYGLFVLLAPRLPVAVRFVAVLALESAWEVCENTDLVIERYRAVTMSLDYYGDSVANSLGDIAVCMLGFVAAARLPARVTAAAVLALEVVLAVWIRDGLLLNVLMLVHPLEAVRAWQTAGHAS